MGPMFGIGLTVAPAFRRSRAGIRPRVRSARAPSDG